MFTVEASVIVPLFTIIVAVLIHMMLILHDKAVENSIEVKMNMRLEFEGGNAQDYEKNAESYLKERLILGGGNIEVKENTLIKNNDMPEFVRITKALTGRKEEKND
jgi:hypothetical protein